MDQPPVPHQSLELDVRLGRAWRDHHRYLLDVAFRILGSIGEAEDAVQEGFARLVDVNLDEIDDVRGWLVVVVSRLCFDQLKSARWQRQTPSTGEAERRPAPDPDPADRVTLDDEVRLALQVVMARLTPAERTAFVLHDVFQYPFEAIGEIVGRTPAACRQLASRARRTITADAGPDRFRVEPAEDRRVTERFIAACSTGDLEGLLEVLDPHVAGVADLGRGFVRTDAGRDRVAAGLLRYLGPDPSTTLVTVPAGDHAGVLALRNGRVFALVTLAVHDGLINHVDALVDPVKLAPIAEALDA